MNGQADAGAWLAAGLAYLDHAGPDFYDHPFDDAELDRLLAARLTPQVWWRTDAARVPKPSGTVDAEPAAPWVFVGAMDGDRAATFAAAWQRAVQRLGPPDFLRLSPVVPDDRDRALSLGAEAGLKVAAALTELGGPFSWHCPVTVTAAGPGAAGLLARLRALPLGGYGFTVVGHGPADVCFLDGDAPATDGCGTVIAVGAGGSYALYERAARSHRTLAVGVAGEDLSWWPEVVNALASNLPLDCALAAVVPDAWVGGLTAPLTATTLEITRADKGWRGPQTEATFRGPSAGGRGAGPVEIEVEGMAAAEPPGAAAADDPRRLVVEFRDGLRKVRTVLPPARPLTLEVAIAVPGRGQAAGAIAVPDPGAAEDVVTLDVVASGPVWPAPQVAQIAWPVHDHDEPSTSAVFALTTPAGGQAVTIGITVLYRGRPLQQADIVAAVRDVAVPGERVRVVVRSTSTPPAPALITTPAVSSLDATGSELRNTFTGAAIGLVELDGVLDAFEQRISRTLGVDDAPESLTDPAAVSLLVDLARQGAGLRDLIAPLGLDGAGAVSLLVQPASRVLPLELVYSGAVPRRTGAKLCAHVHTPPAPGEACDRTSSRVVCPYAFWALNRTVVRTVVLPDGRPRPMPPTLDLEPVLLAASTRADFGAAADRRPSDLLTAACAALFGTVERVTSWTAWRREVAARHPDLLVLLAHTEVAGGEATLQIGRNSFLARPDVSTAMLGGSPLVLLVACASAVAGDEFGTLPGTFTARGAAAVVGLLTKLSGSQGGRAAQAVLTALHGAGGAGPVGLGAALATARRDLVAQGLLVGMMLVAHGEIDVRIGG
ncbi:MAG: hypothetical protein LCH96_09930 [Actinobacteria bacterium]|nr:hypothetical protein [Actinomycetota bacterium]